MTVDFGLTIGKIAEAIGGRLSGDANVVLRRVRPVEKSEKGDLAVVFDRRRAFSLAEFRGSALIVADDPAISIGVEIPSVRVPDPRRSFAEVLRLFHPERRRSAGIDRTAVIAAGARVDPAAFVGPYSVVEEESSIGAGSEIHAHSVVGRGSAVGADTILFPAVTLYPGTRVGDRVRIHSGTVIGADGFGFPREQDGSLAKVPQVGIVVIEDDVEIGANCAIDRATLDETRIGRGTKIDNLVQIGHNSSVGPHGCIMGQVGISGSVQVGAFATLCGQVGIADRVRLDDRVVVGAQSGVPHDLTEGVWLGTPALLATRMRRIFPAFARLAETQREIRELRERLQQLEAALRGTHENG